ncbi:MAG: phosphoribosyltransferase family protein [Actinomycetota bacterium]
MFLDRSDAGRKLADRLRHSDLSDPVAVALPRGGVPVAAQVARGLGAPLDVLVVRKIGCPWQHELGVGAVAEAGIRVLNDELLASLGLTPDDIEPVAQREAAEVGRRVERYRAARPQVPIGGRTAVLIDDGIATGFTVRAGIEVLRRMGANRVVVATPVAAAETAAELRQVSDEVVVLYEPGRLYSIGQQYEDFTQVSDDEVVDELRRSAGVEPPFDLQIPPGATGVVAFAHGSGSSGRSPRNRLVAGLLRDAGLATLQFDLLTPEEAADRAQVFDIALLASRLLEATTWLGSRHEVAGLPVGYFGASTGAAAALRAAAELRVGAERGPAIKAVVSRGGRPDLALTSLAEVAAPTLLLVGGDDTAVLDLNKQALQELRCEKQLEVIAGATHLFEEPGKLERVGDLACQWFLRHFRR